MEHDVKEIYEIHKDRQRSIDDLAKRLEVEDEATATSDMLE